MASQFYHCKNRTSRQLEVSIRKLLPLGGKQKRMLASGGHSREEPPGPIPNPEVKLLCADGSGTIGPVRVGRRQL